MMNLFSTKREKILFIMIISTLFLWITGSYYIKPVLEEVNSLKKLIFLSQFKENNLIKNNKQDIIFNNHKDITIIKANANEETDYANFIMLLEKIAGKVNLPITDMKKLPTDSNDYIKLLSCRIEIEGTMENLIKYINELSKEDNNIGITSVSFQKNQESGIKIKLILELNKTLLL